MSEQTDWARAASWSALVTRWLAAQFVLKRLELVQKAVVIAGAIAAVMAVLCALAAARYEPDWPWFGLGTLLLLLAAGAFVLVRIAMWVVRRLALSRRARPLAGALAESKDRMLAELEAAGVPVSLGTGARFLWALVRRRRPHEGIAGRFRAVVARSDEVLDLPSLRATLDDAVRRPGGNAGPPPPVSR